MEFKGFTYGYDGSHGDYRSPEGIASQNLLYKTGVNWICLAVVAMQETPISTDIEFSFGQTPTDRDIQAFVERAHDNSVSVCLKPMVNCKDGTWRARIAFPDMGEGEEDLYWNAWFKSYSDFMIYYAELAEDTGCEMLCIGCEMCGTEKKEEHWRKLISEIRKVYSGKLIYNTNHGHEDAVKWFDAVDYLGTSAYFPVAEFREAKSIDTGISNEACVEEYLELVEEMKSNWQRISNEMEAFSRKWGKKIVFIEIGCRSARGCASMPWDFSHRNLPIDQDEQAAFYDSCLSVFSNKEWFGGMFWWDWSTFIYDDQTTADSDIGFNIHLKKAENVLKEWYAKL